MKAKYITIDGSRTQIKSGLYTGHQLKSLGELPPDSVLLLDNKGEIDVSLGDSELIVLEGGEQFVSATCAELPSNPCYQKPISFSLNCIAYDGDKGFGYAKVTGREILATDSSIDANDRLFIDIDGSKDEPLSLDQTLVVHQPLTFVSAPCGNVGESVQVPPILHQHFIEVQAHYPQARLEPTSQGYLLIIDQYPLPKHWSLQQVSLCLQVPQGYPSCPLDMFYLYPTIALIDGRVPDRGDHPVTLLGRVWQRFSWHYQNRPWNINVDSLRSHLRFCDTRLAMAQ